MTHRFDEMSVHDVTYRLASRYPGGVEALSLRMGLGRGTLRKKLIHSVETHHLSLDEFMSVVDMATDVRREDALMPLRALCWHFGGVFIPMPDVPHAQGDAFLRQVVKTAKEQGDIIARVDKALRNDGKVDARELREIEKEFEEAISAQAELLEVLRSIAAAK